jgi:phosphatidylglycerol:prolipoprotein diacylglycerol transferase
MHPVLLKFGIFEIRSYGALLAVSFIVGIYVAMRRARRAEIDVNAIVDLSVVVLISSIVGARLLYAFTHLDEFKDDYWAIINPMQKEGTVSCSGLIFFGGLLLSIITGFLYVRAKKLPFWKIGDVVAPSIALGVFLTRIGCFLNGCCYGTACALPWGVHFPENSPAGFFQQIYGYQHIHPSQLYESAWGLVMLAILLLVGRRKRFDGLLLLLTLALYSIERFFVDMTRFYDPESTVHLFGLSASINQVISLALFVAALAVIIFKYRRAAKHTESPSVNVEP